MTINNASSRRLLALAGWVLLCFAAAAMGGLFMPGEWYASLKKPSWNPPGWIFGPVWTALYSMMAVAAWLVWRRDGWGKQRKPLLIFLTQLALNALWTPLFFGLHWTAWHLQKSCCFGWPSRGPSPRFGACIEPPPGCSCHIWRGWVSPRY